MKLLDHYAKQLEILQQQGNLREFVPSVQQQQYIYINDLKMLNLSGNDYLALAGNLALREQFFAQNPDQLYRMSASSSRLLTGNFSEYQQLETALTQAFHGRSALVFNSGYHMNLGILPAICDHHTLILADKLVHASMIDGIRLSSAKYVRYRHNDLQHLVELIEKYHADAAYKRIIVVTESIFSMDGDETDLTRLVQIKQQFSKVMLYVDEAHAIGVRGHRGLGCAEQYGVIADIDFLVGTFGKALASVGGYLICHEVIRQYLINTMRPLIFSTAQPPVCMAWTKFIFEHMQTLSDARQDLAMKSDFLRQQLLVHGFDCPSSSHIIPVIIGDSKHTVLQAKLLQDAGFYIMPVRPPTVPQRSSRLRISLNTSVEMSDLQQLVHLL